MSLTFFFFNDTATTEIYTLSLHDALPISTPQAISALQKEGLRIVVVTGDRKESARMVADKLGIAEVRAEVLPEEKSEVVKRSEEHTSELQSQSNLVCRLLLEKKKDNTAQY